MTTALAFQSTTFDVVTRNNQPWIRSPQIGGALGYGRRGHQIDAPLAERAMRNLYARHADEFTDEMTAVVKLPTEGGEQDVRIFSLRGCHLLAMFARTPVAKAFRKWVLDVLDERERARVKRASGAERTRRWRERQRQLALAEAPRVAVDSQTCNKQLRTAADIAEAIRLVESIRERVRREHWPREFRCGDRRDEARYELQWDMFRACNSSLAAAAAALCASAEVSDWA